MGLVSVEILRLGVTILPVNARQSHIHQMKGNFIRPRIAPTLVSSQLLLSRRSEYSMDGASFHRYTLVEDDKTVKSHEIIHKKRRDIHTSQRFDDDGGVEGGVLGGGLVGGAGIGTLAVG
jgi:hypothetical protein